MRSVETLLIPPLISSVVIRLRSIILIIFNLYLKSFVIRSIILIIFNFFFNLFVIRLKRYYHFLKCFGRHIETLFDFITGNHCSLVNVSDGDFSVGRTAHQLFRKKERFNDNNKAGISDLFHIYLSKVLYESNTRIIEYCTNWGFNIDSIKVFTYDQSDDFRTYTYSTKAAAIYYKASNRIIIAFRGTEPMDLSQWLTDASADFIDISNRFNDLINDDDKDIRVHAGFFHALGLDRFDRSIPIDYNNVTSQSPIFIQLLNFIRKSHRKTRKRNISITGHSLGGGLASLFTYVLLANGYESSISGVYTYGQPLVGNRSYAEILNNKLGNRFHRWVNNGDIVTRIPVIELPSIGWFYARTPYSDSLEVAGNNNPKKSYHYYYHSGLRFRINNRGNLEKQNSIDKGPMLAYRDKINLFDLIYSIKRAIYSLLDISPIRCILWLIVPNEINDHFPGEYARKIKTIVYKHR